MTVIRLAAAGLRQGDDLLAALADPARKAIPAHHVAVIVAHPDDETIGCGAQLARLIGATIIVVSDGAPRDLADARSHGFDTTAGYAAARDRELAAALALAGVPRDRVVRLGLADQGVGFALVDVACRLADLCCDRGITVALTHAYEGGHPDHDATAFAVHAARALVGLWRRSLAIVEMPFYRLEETGLVTQRFAADDRGETVLALDAPAQALKRAMIAAHATQRETLSLFSTDAERFRPAPVYDFTALPNGGRLFYAQHPWGMTAECWLDLTHRAIAELGSGTDPCH